MRCFEQKCPWQKLQSPTIRWAASLHSLKLHLGLRGAIVDDCGSGLAGEAKGLLGRRRE